MLASMTGFGAASTCENGYVISTEIKAVNNRFLKTSIRLPDGLAALESKIEERLRTKLARGSVNFTLRLEREAAETEIGVNFNALKRYLSEAKRFALENPELARVDNLGALVEYLRLPGVAQDASRSDGEKARLPELLGEAIVRCVDAALEQMQAMREAEGESMKRDLTDNLGELRRLIGEVEALAPTVVENYRRRLTERVSKVLAEEGATLNPGDLIREIAVYTDRVDISEEIVRFYSHLKQFEETMEREATCGKKLDFITQEMFRETNTIGSKANSPDVLARVVEMKSGIERIREMVQNVE